VCPRLMNKPAFKFLENIYEVGGNSSSRIASMEGLRGLAVILVFFVHYHALFAGRLAADSVSFGISKFLSVNGNSGVDLFFVLSGYLIYGAVIKKFDFSTFLTRRVQRIYPAFFIVVAIYLAASLIVPSRSKLPADFAEGMVYILQNILLLPGMFAIEPIITVAWSLSYEFFFYLFLPLLVVGLQLQNRKPKLRAALFASLAFFCITYSFFGAFSNLKLVMFVSGILVYEAVKSFRLHEKVTPKIDILALVLFAFSLFATFLLLNSPERIYLADRAQLKNVLHLIVLFVTFFTLVLGCIGSRTILKSVFSLTPLRWLGNMSYSYYLIHGFTLQCVAYVLLKFAPQTVESSPGFWAFMMISFTVTWISSTILFVAVEKPFSLGAPARSTPKISAPSFAKIIENEQ
jgi:peptidoglycan/LPS O-acetylase OafA/YrhL